MAGSLVDAAAAETPQHARPLASEDAERCCAATCTFLVGSAVWTGRP